MTARRTILGLIILTVLAFCLLAAAKLAATPKYDRIQMGMKCNEVLEILENEDNLSSGSGRDVHFDFDRDEGRIRVTFSSPAESLGRWGDNSVASKTITSRGPLERLAWLMGWRPSR